MWTLKLLKVNQMPSDFREPFIVSCYRSSRSSFICCFKSIFQQTNETLNFWTHFIPLIYFVWKLFVMLNVHNVFKESYSWPILIYLFSLSLCLFGSCIAHLFNCISEHARHICFFFDYAAISMFSMGAAVAYRYYIFPESLIGGRFYHAFLSVVAFNSILATTMACCSRFGDRERLKELLRLLSFVLPYTVVNIPLVIRLVTCYSHHCWTESLTFHGLQFLTAAIGSSAYATHIPECMAPGMFDVWGHSHQILHISSAVGFHYQLKALTLDMMSRRDYLDESPTFFCCFGIFIIALVVNMLTIYVFSSLIRHEDILKKYTGRLLYSKNEDETISNIKLKQS